MQKLSFYIISLISAHKLPDVILGSDESHNSGRVYRLDAFIFGSTGQNAMAFRKPAAGEATTEIIFKA